MTLTQLKSKIASGAIDTVIVACPDVFGRLVGKRFTGKFFLDQVAKHGTHACSYLLTVDIEMDPQDGFKLANWEKGFGDFEMRPDFSTVRFVPWQSGTALVLCDYLHHDGRFVVEAPRSVLRRQVDALAKKKLTCRIASELEFFLFNESFHDAFAAEYRNITPSSDYRIDYHTLQPGRDEFTLRAVRNWMTEARVPVESSKGEWGRGQHEVNFVYAEPLPMADMHVVFKQGIKEIAAQHVKSVTFMAKPWAAEVGSSCHIHISLWRAGKNLFGEAVKRGTGMAGIEEELDCGPDYRGNAYVDPKLRALPRSLREAADLLDRSKLARRAFGNPVIDFYVHTARLEVQACNDAVTDWERIRYFER